MSSAHCAAENYNPHSKRRFFIELFDCVDFESTHVVEGLCPPSMSPGGKLDVHFEGEGKCRVEFVFMCCTVCFRHTMGFEILVLALYFMY